MLARRKTDKPRCGRLLSVDLLGTPREHCWRAAGHQGPCPHPTRGNDVRTMTVGRSAP